MTTSGSVDFSITRDNLITDALAIVGAIGEGDTPSSVQTTAAARRLNIFAKSLEQYGLSLWARKTGYILPTTDVSSISLGPSGGHATLSYVQTTLSSSPANGASTITVTSATGIANGYYIGIELSDSTMFWTTVNGAPSGTTITLTSVLTGASTSGNYVYCYQTKLQRPVRVVDAYIHDQLSGNDTSIEIVAKSRYDQLGNKTSEGSPVQITYDPQLDNGVLYIYPRFQNGRKLITIIFQRPFEDFDVLGDTPDFPHEWYEALMYGLAARLAPVYGLPVQDRVLLRQEADIALGRVLSNEPEEGSFQIMPRYYG